MSTNYHRIPIKGEINARKELLIKRINDMELTPANIEREFCYIVPNDIPNDIPFVDCYNTISPWSEFLKEMKIHLGLRSPGWKFTWDFHKNKYYSDKEELLSFIRSGRVIDEYGKLIENEEFIEMALNWEQPNGLVNNEEYFRNNKLFGSFAYDPKLFDRTVDGLNVSASTSTDF
jgi:hypothetical protein